MTDITMINVVSSNVSKVGYDKETKELHVQFLNGTEYKYLNVPESVFHNLLAAPSVGKYLNSQVKPTYEVERIA